MRQLWTIFFIIFLSIVAGMELMKEPGYVMILFHGWQIQTSLVIISLMLVASILAFVFFFDILNFLLHIPKKIKHIYQLLIGMRQTQQLRMGLQAYFQEDWLNAMKRFSHTSASVPWIVDLMAAQAAQNQGFTEQRDKYLHMASLQEPKARDTILLFQANLQYQQGQYEQCQASLKNFATQNKNIPAQWYWLQCKLYRQFKEFEKGLNLLKDHPYLQKSNAKYFEFYKLFLMACLKQYFKNQEFEKAYQELKKLPKKLKDDDDLLILCAPHLIKDKAYAKFINQWIEKSIKIESNQLAILKLLEKLPKDPLWLKVLDKLSSQGQHDSQFYLYLAKIKCKHQLWGSAIQDVEKSLALKKTPEGYSTLAKIYLELQQTSNALNAMQNAIHFEYED
jgi:HemY protein